MLYVYLNPYYHSCIATCSTWFKLRFRRKLIKTVFIQDNIQRPVFVLVVETPFPLTPCRGAAAHTGTGTHYRSCTIIRDTR
jgi:hypothetical protein